MLLVSVYVVFFVFVVCFVYFVISVCVAIFHIIQILLVVSFSCLSYCMLVYVSSVCCICCFCCCRVYVCFLFAYCFLFALSRHGRSASSVPHRPLLLCVVSVSLSGVRVCLYISFSFLTQRVFPTSSWCLLRRWTGDPPETLSGLTSNPLSLMW